jgi:hypothetical protein
LKGIGIEKYVLDNNTDGTWIGRMFNLKTRDKSRYRQLDDAAKILFDYLNKRIEVVRKIFCSMPLYQLPDQWPVVSKSASKQVQSYSDIPH